MSTSSCVIYRLGGRLFVVSQYASDWGWLLASTPVYARSAGDSADRIGAAVLESLEHFKQDVPHPAEVPEADDPVLRAVGVASWEGLSSRKAEMCSVESDGAVVTVMPNSGDENGGYTPDPAKSRKCEMTAEAVGRGVLSAFGSAA